MAASRKPAAELSIDGDLVHELLVEQHPDLAELPLRAVAEGWDNVLYRLGAEFAVRMPRRQAAADLVEHEHRWLPELAPRLPLPIAAPIWTGSPNDRYPWRWTICPWFEGTHAVGVIPAAGAGRTLGEFVHALHQPAPPDAPQNAYRGTPLSSRNDMTRERIARLADTIDAAQALQAWERALDVPGFVGEQAWLHGDLHPGNLIVGEAGTPAAVVDFGDLTSGDPACDLAIAWMWLDEPERSEFLGAAGSHDDATIARARGWALSLGIACLANSADAPEMGEVGRATLARLDAG